MNGPSVLDQICVRSGLPFPKGLQVCSTQTLVPLRCGGFSVGHSPHSTLKACIRVTSAQAKTLYDCKDGLLFFRAFVRNGSNPKLEDDVMLIWTNKFTTVNSLTVVANTLQGLRGYVANAQGLGVRIDKRFIAAARAVLQECNGKIFEINRNIAGTLLFEVH